ncbi:MAG TPA: hypothetical protein VHW90_01710 [Stellaceae bacterium]|jgi:hypothetical protein|nr:hypothetical protein [Stellaceae bacterium]
MFWLMEKLRPARWGSAAALTVMFAVVALVTAPAPAAARVFVGIGFWPGYYYGSWPYYYPPAYYPYYYPPPAAYYQPPAGYAPPNGYAPSAGYQPPATYGAPAMTNTAGITYTNRPEFRNRAGQTCREFSVSNGGGQPRYGTACRGNDGQWRVSN